MDTTLSTDTLLQRNAEAVEELKGKSVYGYRVTLFVSMKDVSKWLDQVCYGK